MRSNSCSIASSSGGSGNDFVFVAFVTSASSSPPPSPPPPRTRAGPSSTPRSRCHDRTSRRELRGRLSPCLHHVANLRGEDHTIPIRGVYLIYIRDLQYCVKFPPPTSIGGKAKVVRDVLHQREETKETSFGAIHQFLR